MTNTNTEEEISPERKKELAREGSLMNLEDRFLSGIGAYGIASASNSNEFGENSLNYLMAYATNKSPSQAAYEKSGLKEMLQSGAHYGINDTIRSKCTNIVVSSIRDLKIKDVLEYRGLKEGEVKEYEGKEDMYISDLDESEQNKLISLYQRPFIKEKIFETYNWIIEQENKSLKGEIEKGSLIENLSPEQREKFEKLFEAQNN